MAKRKKYFQAALPMAVVDELQAVVEEHPELGINSPTEAVKRAVLEWTKQLKRHPEGSPEPLAMHSADDLVEAMSKYFVLKEEAEKKPPGARKSKT